MERIERAYEVYNLLSKHLKEELSDEEKTQLDNWVNQSGVNRSLFLEISNPDSLKKAVLDYYKIVEEQEAEESGEGEMGSVVNVYVKSSSKTTYYMAAASIIGLIAIGLWLRLKPINNKNEPTKSDKVGLIADASPAQSVAHVILADGSSLAIDSILSGSVVNESGAKILKRKDGSLSYMLDRRFKASDGVILYNTVSVPRGSNTVNLTLSDGTKAILNTGSSITYPIFFDYKKERIIELTGEAYFEVTHNKSKPFKVKGKDILIEVVGTKFNVNLYDDEIIKKTTLLEGVISVSTTTSDKWNKYILKPGQQAQIAAYNINSKIKIVNDVDEEEILAWKNGKFYFNNTDLDIVMRQIGRWYDLDIFYEYDYKKNPLKLVGEISRYNNASKVLEMIKAAGFVHFKIEGKKVIVSQ